MPELDIWNLIIALAAFILSGLAFWQSSRTRLADSFAKLYDEFNTRSFGADMECIGVWIDGVAAAAKKERNALTEAEIRRAYRDDLEALRSAGKNTKNDPIEGARRSVKAWFIKCLLYREARDLSRKHLSALITADRAAIMLCVFAMTREQADFWKGSTHNPGSRNSSDEPYFLSLEGLAAKKGVRVMQPHNPPMHPTGSAGG